MAASKYLSAADVAQVRAVCATAWDSTLTPYTRSQTKDSSGRDVVSYAAATAVKCNIAPWKGGEQQLPDSLRNLSVFKVSVPVTMTIAIKDQCDIDGTRYEVHDDSEATNPDAMARILLVSTVK